MFKHCLNHEKNTFYPCPPCLNFLTFADRNERYSITDNCEIEVFEGMRTSIYHLYGNVREVKNPADATFRVLRVNSYPDICVNIVKNPCECGEWRFVTKGGNFTVYFVKSEKEWYDFTIAFRKVGNGGLGLQRRY